MKCRKEQRKRANTGREGIIESRHTNGRKEKKKEESQTTCNARDKGMAKKEVEQGTRKKRNEKGRDKRGKIKTIQSYKNKNKAERQEIQRKC